MLSCREIACSNHRVSENEIYKRSDVLVVGVSSDPVDKQKAFVEKNNLPVRFLPRERSWRDDAHWSHSTLS